MKSRARIVSGLAALAALFLAPIAQASIARVSVAERTIEAPALTLASAPELSEFSLFEGTELTPAAAESARGEGFHPLAAVSLLSKDGAERPLVSVDELIYPRTRYRVFGLLGTPILGELRGVSLELHWRSTSFSCGLASGTVGWLSQDPAGDADSVNLYGFVGMRPHEATDPLGLQTGQDINELQQSRNRVTQFTGELGIYSGYIAQGLELGVNFGPGIGQVMNIGYLIEMLEKGHYAAAAGVAAGGWATVRVLRYLRAAAPSLWGRLAQKGAKKLEAAEIAEIEAVLRARPSSGAAGESRLSADVARTLGETTASAWSKLSADARRYLRDIELQTGRAVNESQRKRLAEVLRSDAFSKLDLSQAAKHRAEFGRVKNDLIEAWERATGEEWPRYASDVISESGTILRRAGQPYDAHHIIQSSFGGPNEWWNIHPARFPAEHQGGIHRAGSPAREIFE